MFNLQPKLNDGDQLPEELSTNHQPSDGDLPNEEQSKSFNGLSTSEKSAAGKQPTKPFGVDDQQSSNGQPPKKPNADSQSPEKPSADGQSPKKSSPDGQQCKELVAADQQRKE